MLRRAVYLMCASLLAAAAPAQQVIKGDANLLHRSRLSYPESAKGISGTLVIAATLDERGVVTDAHVTSGPEPFRKPALQSVLDWHYAPGTPSPVEIVIAYRPPPALLNGQPAQVAAQIRKEPPPKLEAGILNRIQFAGKASQFEEKIREKLPIREGDPFNVDAVAQIIEIVREVDEHLSVNFRMIDFDGEKRRFELRSAYLTPVE